MGEEREPHYLSGEWLRTRTNEQLHAIVDGNFPKGKAFEGARAELDRREAKGDQRRQLFWIKMTFWATIILAIAGIAATLAS